MVFSTVVSKFSFRQNLSLYNCLFLPQADLLELRPLVIWQSLFRRRAFSVVGPMTWNSLPDNFHDPTLIDDKFKAALKTLFSSIIRTLSSACPGTFWIALEASCVIALYNITYCYLLSGCVVLVSAAYSVVILAYICLLCRWHAVLCSLALLLYLLPLRFVTLLCFNLLLLRQPLCFCELFVYLDN